MHLTIDEFVIADEPGAWSRAGFSVDDSGICRVGTLALRLTGSEGSEGSEGGIEAWSLRGLSEVTDLDGVPTTVSTRPSVDPDTHPNGVVALDHAVLMSPDLPRTEGALHAIGLEPRRRRDGELNGTPIRQVFYRLGDVVLELVGSPDASGGGPAHFWGLTFTVSDIDVTAKLLGESLGRIKDAVQPGRRIATLRHRGLGISVATAFISADPRRQGS